MRPEILSNLPAMLPRNKEVLITGPNGAAGQNQIKELVHELNRNGKWIRMEFSKVVQKDAVTENVSVVLPMTHTTGISLQRVRAGAEKRGASIPSLPLTVGETKEALMLLNTARNGIIQPPLQNSNVNPTLGTVLNGNNGTGDSQSLAALAQKAAHDFASLLEQSSNEDVSSTEQESVEPPPISSSLQTTEEVDLALETIAAFRVSFDEVELAVLTVADQLKAVTKERDEIQSRLQLLEKEVVALRESIANRDSVIQENRKLLEKNKILTQEVEQNKDLLKKFEALRKIMNND